VPPRLETPHAPVKPTAHGCEDVYYPHFHPSANLGNLYWSIKDYPSAINAYSESLEQFLKTDSRSAAASVFHALWFAHRHVGDAAASAQAWTVAQRLFMTMGDEHMSGICARLAAEVTGSSRP
jgi:hypothetical protein